MRLKTTSFLFLILLSPFPDRASSQTWRELYLKADSLSDLEIAEKLPEALPLALASLDKAEQQFGESDANLAPILELIAILHESGQRTSLTMVFANT